MNDQNNMAKGGCCPGVSWNAIFAGALIAIGLSFLLNLLCLAIGLTAFSTTSEGASTFVAGGFLGLTISAIIAMFMGGLVAGSLAKSRCCEGKHNVGELHGFAAWCVALLFMMLTAGPSSALILSANNSVNHAMANVQASSGHGEPLTADKAHSAMGNPNLSVNGEVAAETMAATSFATFFLFFIGALSSSFGGRCGVMCCRKGKMACSTKK